MSKILLVDCEPILCEHFKQAVEATGYKTKTVYGLPAMVDAIGDQPPDILVCDLVCHGLNVAFLSQEMEKLPVVESIPILYLVSPVDQVAIWRLLRPIDNLLAGEVDVDTLLPAIEACFQKRDQLNGQIQGAKSQLQNMLESIANISDLIQHKSNDKEYPKNEPRENRIYQAVEQLLRRHSQSIWASEADFGGLLDNIGIGVYRGSTDSQGKLLHASPAMARMFGYPSISEFMSVSIACMYAVPSERKEFVDEIRKHGAVKNKVLRMHRRDGAMIWVEVTSRGQFDREGKLQWVEGILNDITERKRAEADLEHERELLNSLMDQIPDQIYFKDVNSRFTRINRQQAHILGLAKPEEAIGKSDYDYFDHASQAFADEQIIINSGRPLINKVELMRTASGEHRWVSSTKAPIMSKTGEAIGIVGITRDIHEMKKAEETLAQRMSLTALNAEIGKLLAQEGNLTAILQSCAESIIHHLDASFVRVWTLNETHDILRLQASAGLTTELSGEYSSIPMGQGKMGMIAQTRKPFLSNAVARDARTTDPGWASSQGLVAVVGYPLLVEERIVGVLAIFARHPLPIVVVSALDSLANNIAVGVEHKQAAEKLRKNEELFRLITENAADLIAVIDRRGLRRYVSPSFEKTLGYDLKELMAMEPFAEIHPADRQRISEAMHTAFATETFERVEFRLRHKDGTYRVVEATASVIHELNSHGDCMVSVARDITERKQALEDLEKASRQAGMAEVASSVLHNVGNVLNSVNTSASIIQDRTRKLPVNEAAKVADLLEKNLEKLNSFLEQDNRARQIIDFLKKVTLQATAEQKAVLEESKELSKYIDHIKDIISMQQNYAKVTGIVEKVKAEDLVEDALRMHASALLRHDVHVTRMYSPEVIELVVEKHKALQILVNLVHNAKYACDQGGGQEKELNLRIYPGGAGVCIEVADNGVGIPAENMTKIFNHGFTTRKNGHGFGLHSSALAAKEMGGTLQAFSEGPGKGATFTLSLPLEPKESSHESPE